MKTLPTIHTNGTGKGALALDYGCARRDVRFALSSFESIEFNARDYYPQGPDAFTAARIERDAIATKLAEVLAYLDAHLAHIENA